MQKYILAFAVIGSLAGCGPKTIFRGEKEMPNSVWTYRDSAVFAFEIRDTAKLYNLFLDIGVKNSFESENVYVQLHTQLPNGQWMKAVRSFDVFDKEGKILGKKSGDGAGQHIMLQENTRFNQVGPYKIVVEQYMRGDSLGGVTSLGLAVEETK